MNSIVKDGKIEYVGRNKMSEYDFLKIFESIIDEADKTPDEEGIQGLAKDALDKSKLRASGKKDKIHQNVEEDEEGEVEKEEKSSDSEDSVSDDSPESGFSNKTIDVSTSFSDWIEASGELRASKSFKDKKVKEELKQYFDSLSDSEKKSLYIFFKGITLIAAAGVDGGKVDSPEDLGVKMNSHVKPTSKKIKKKSEKSSGEKENPIIVGESVVQDKSDILKVINEINNKWED